MPCNITVVTVACRPLLYTLASDSAPHITRMSKLSLSLSSCMALGHIFRHNTSYAAAAQPSFVSLPWPAIIAAQPLASLFIPSSHREALLVPAAKILTKQVFRFVVTAQLEAANVETRRN